LLPGAGVVGAGGPLPLGRATNNVAEYSGLIAGLEAAAELGASRVTVRMDSKLVVEQMSGRWQVKHPDMKPLAKRAATLAAGFDRVDWEWVPRAKNTHADRLANEAMDEAAAGRVWAAPIASVSDPPDPAAEMPRPTVVARDGQPTRFLVIRHGETTYGVRGRFTGREDVDLTERGRRQATAVAERVRTFGPSVVLTSPLQRCRDTAAAIAAATGAAVTVDDRLLDEGLGDWTGLRVDEIERGWPAEFAVWRREPASAPPGGESFTQVRERVKPLMTESLTTHRGHTVALVTHGAVAKMILITALQVDPAVAYRLRVDTGSLSGFTVADDGSIVLWTLNDTVHLD
jgi:broad specificity phosphatase PhoE/ribonuclease HI